MKPHEFNNLVNDIRFITTHVMGIENLPGANTHLYYMLASHSYLKNLPCKDVTVIWIQCVEYVKTQQLRAHIVKALANIGVVPDHEHDKHRLEVAQAGFDMALSLKNSREQGPGPCLA